MENHIKRPLCDTSPEELNKNTKRISDMSETGDAFSWDIFDRKISKLLENVAKKDDILDLQRNLDEVKEENKNLRNDLENLKSKMSAIDKFMRRSNVIFSGINCENYQTAKTRIMDICLNILNIHVNITKVVMLKRNYEFLVELETNQQAIKIILSGSKLKNLGIFVHKDYSSEDRDKRFQLRKLKKKLRECDNSTKCTFKNTSILVDDKQYNWHDGNVIAGSVDDKNFLLAKLGNFSDEFNIVVNQRPSRNINGRNANGSQAASISGAAGGSA